MCVSSKNIDQYVCMYELLKTASPLRNILADRPFLDISIIYIYIYNYIGERQVEPKPKLMLKLNCNSNSALLQLISNFVMQGQIEVERIS